MRRTTDLDSQNQPGLAMLSEMVTKSVAVGFADLCTALDITANRRSILYLGTGDHEITRHLI